MSFTPISGNNVSAQVPVSQRKGKAPPFKTFSGESKDVRLDDWLPSLKRVSSWNVWTEEEELIQLAGNLKGRAQQEWNLLQERERSTLDSAVKSLRNRLESGAKAMAAQDFQHCAQHECEEVSDFIARLEKTFCLRYRHEAMSKETQDTLLYGQLHEGPAIRIMEAPSVSGATDYSCLCVAARNEERRQIELQKRRAYQTSALRHQHASLPPQSSTRHPQQGSHQPQGQRSAPQPSGPPLSPMVLPNLGRTHNRQSPCQGRRITGLSSVTIVVSQDTLHMTPPAKKESTGSGASLRRGRESESRLIQSDLAEVRADADDDPLGYLLSDSDSPEEGVRQVRVHDEGSKPQFAKVSVQGVPMLGVVDTGADISIINGSMFKRVAAVARLRKRDFKPPDKTSYAYDKKPFQLDGRLNLDITFQDKTMNTVL